MQKRNEHRIIAARLTQTGDPTQARKKRRTRNERRQAMRALMIGVLITALAIALDGSGKLQRLEWALYDTRVRLCQFFRKLPTDRLVHVDIDDSALETIGRWPW